VQCCASPQLCSQTSDSFEHVIAQRELQDVTRQLFAFVQTVEQPPPSQSSRQLEPLPQLIVQPPLGHAKAQIDPLAQAKTQPRPPASGDDVHVDAHVSPEPHEQTSSPMHGAVSETPAALDVHPASIGAYTASSKATHGARLTRRRVMLGR
jgi:hypothetical protein